MPQHEPPTAAQQGVFWIFGKVHHVLDLPLRQLSSRRLLVQVRAVEKDVSSSSLQEEFVVSHHIEKATASAGGECSSVLTILQRCEGDIALNVSVPPTASVDFVLKVWVLRRTGGPAPGIERYPIVSYPFKVDLPIVVEKKVHSMLLPTPAGRFGLSFSVSHLDIEGFRHRLKMFLQKYNPDGIPHVDVIISKVSEVEIFTKLRHKYNAMDYKCRLRKYLRLYELCGTSPKEEEDLLQTTLQQWEMQEENLFCRLVLEHGPEPEDIPRAARVNALFHKVGLTVPISVNVEECEKESSDAFDKRMASWVAQYATEANPSSYLFSSIPALPDVPPDIPGASSSEQGAAKAAESSIIDVPSVGNVFVTAAPGETKHAQLTANDERRAWPVDSQISGIVAPQQLPPRAAAITRDNEIDSLWGKFCRKLTDFGVPMQPIWYLNRDRFAGLCSELQISPPSLVEAFTAERDRRLYAASQFAFLSSTDPRSIAAHNDLLNTSGLTPLQCHLQSLMLIQNGLHEEVFGERCRASGGMPSKCYAIGDAGKVMDVIFFGFQNCPTFFRCSIGAQLGDALSKFAAAVVLCDVLCGRVFETSGDAPETISELEGAFDSARCHLGTNDEALVIYSPQRILPRLILWCSFDLKVVSCSAHPRTPAVNGDMRNGEPPMCASCFRGFVGMDRGGHGAPAPTAPSVPSEWKVLLPGSRPPPKDPKPMDDGTVQKLNESLERNKALTKEIEKMKACKEDESQRTQQEILQRLVLSQEETVKLLSHQQNVQPPAEVGKETVVSAPSSTHQQRLARYQQAKNARISPAEPLETSPDAKRSAFVHATTAVQTTVPEVQAVPIAPATPTSSHVLSQVSPLHSWHSSVVSVQPPFEAPHFMNTSQEPSIQDIGQHGISKGWELFRAGSFDAAAAVWRQVCEHCGPNCCTSFEAAGLICEVIDKNPIQALEFYRHGLSVDPLSTPTLFRCANILETKLHEHDEALSMFELAHRLGDVAAGRRADLLRRRRMIALYT